MAEALSMSKEHREILKKKRAILERDLQAVQLLKYLTEILLEEDYENVKAERTPTEQARALLDVLPRKGCTSFVCFVKALWRVQPHLAHILSQEAGLEEPSDVEENDKLALPQELRTKLRSPTLRAYLKGSKLNKIIKLMRVVFTKEDIELINKHSTTDDKVDEFLSVLPRKGRSAYEHFVEVVETVDPRINILNVMEGKSPYNSTSDSNSQVEKANQKKPFTVHPVNETPISQIKDHLQTFYSVTNQCNGWPKLAQEFQLLHDNYTGHPNPTGAVINDWINNQGDTANVSILKQTLAKYGLHECEQSLDVLLSSNDNADAPIDILTKQTAQLSTNAFVPAKEHTVPFVPKNLQDLNQQILLTLKKQILEEAHLKDIDHKVEKDKIVLVPQSIRDLTRYLRQYNLRESIIWMKKNLPAGVTGPLLDENTNIRDLPYKVRSKLTIHLTNEHNWMLLAEDIGMDPAVINYLKQQYKNPADEVLKDWQTKAHSKVGGLYDILVKLELPVIADLL